MNKQKINDWEIKLGVIQVVIVLSVALGSILGAYLFGLYTGRRHGFDAARSASTTQSPRLPITRDGSEKEASPEDVSKIYAKLRNSIGSREGFEDQPEAADIPEISPIKTTIDAPVIEDLAGGLIQGKENSDAGGTEGGVSNSLVEPRIDVGRETLGTMIRKDEEKDRDESLSEAVSEKREQFKESFPSAREDFADKPAVEMKAALNNQAVSSEISAQEEVQPKEQEKKPSAAISSEGESSHEKTIAVKPVDPVKKDVPKKTQKIMRAISSLPKGWFAQVSAPREIDEANFLVSQLKASGFRAYIERAQFSGQSYYRVVVGPEEDRQQAERLREQLSREKFIKGDPFIRKIK